MFQLKEEVKTHQFLDYLEDSEKERIRYSTNQCGLSKDILESRFENCTTHNKTNPKGIL